MKKLLFTVCAFAGLAAANAQDNLLQFFPNNEGTQLVSKCYDANHNLQGTMTMTVTKNYEYFDGQELDIVYVMADANGNTLNQGKIDAQYMDGTFMMDMKSNALSPSVGQYIGMMTELSDDFLDYPNLFADPMLLQSDFEMDGGSFTIRSADNKDVIATVRKYGRQIEGTEQVTTPAGTFDATKISFSIEVTGHEKGEKATYRGMEWYSSGAGIVRSEIYDTHHNLLDYTVLAELNKPHRR